jgi:7-cyano-7-deazaguanine synthase
MKKAILALSGGMDSTSLLLHLLANDYLVWTVSFDYGQKHVVELERAKMVVDYLHSNGIGIDRLTHDVIDLKTLTQFLSSSLITSGSEVPEGHYEQENMKATVVPNRNKIFSSILQAIALSLANDTESPVKIAMGIHSGDHAIYPDCRQEFRDLDYQAFVSGNWDAERVEYLTPYLDMDKYGILVDAELSCERLQVDFDEVFKRTNTSYKPLQVNGQWFSDYKSASSVERIEAFINLNRPDPVAYADETGPVSWEVASNHVKNILANASK